MIDNKRILTIIGIDIFFITLSNVIGHFAPPSSIVGTPFLMTVIIAVINYPIYKTNFRFAILLNSGLLIFNDLFIRFFAGGVHDQQGKGWVSLFFAISFVLFFIIMIIYAIIIGLKVEKNQRTKLIFNNCLTLIISSLILGFVY